MKFDVVSVCDTFEIERTSEIETSDTELERMKDDLLKASRALTKACESYLTPHSDLSLKDIRTLSQVITNLNNAYFGKSEVVVNNYQQNISNTQLNFFKSIQQDEI